MSILPQRPANGAKPDPDVAESTRALQARRKSESMIPKNQGFTSTSQIASGLTSPDPMIQGDIDSKESTIPKNQRLAFWIKVLLRGKYADVERIVANWRVERQAAPRLATAIRLYDAILRGDRDTIREISPLLMPEAAPEPRRAKRRSSPPSSDLDSYNESKSKKEDGEGDISDPAFADLVEALREVTGADIRVKPATWKSALRLHTAGYTGGNVRAFGTWWAANDWRGRKGDLPEMGQLEDRISVVRGVEPSPLDGMNQYMRDLWLLKGWTCQEDEDAFYRDQEM
jgi:hypothetical protein